MLCGPNQEGGEEGERVRKAGKGRSSMKPSRAGTVDRAERTLECKLFFLLVSRREEGGGSI